MIETRETTINEEQYSCTQLPARRALRLQYKLIKLFGPGVSLVLRPDMSKGKMEGATFTIGINQQAIASAIMSITSQMDDAAFEGLIKEILQGVRKGGRELTDSFIDHEFAGDMGTLWKVVWFALGTNYDSFFGDRGFGSLFSDSSEQEAQNTQTTPQTA